MRQDRQGRDGSPCDQRAEPATPCFSFADDGSQGTNVGIIVGPIVGILVPALAIAGFVLYRRRRRAFQGFSSGGHSPANSGKRPAGRGAAGCLGQCMRCPLAPSTQLAVARQAAAICAPPHVPPLDPCFAGDVESQYGTAAEDSAAFGEARSLREKYGSGSSLGRGASSQGTYADAMRSLRQSQESLMRGSQEAFKQQLRGGDGPLAASMAATQAVGRRPGSPPRRLHDAGAGQAPVASATPGLADMHPLRRSLTSSGNNSSGDASQHTGGSQVAAPIAGACLACVPINSSSWSVFPHPQTSSPVELSSLRPLACRQQRPRRRGHRGHRLAPAGRQPRPGRRLHGRAPGAVGAGLGAQRPLAAAAGGCVADQPPGGGDDAGGLWVGGWGEWEVRVPAPHPRGDAHS